MFQQKTAPEILRTVLEEALSLYGREIRVELDGTYPRREYCLQYEETDLAFAHRLMEEEGISYSFDHEGDAEVMVLRDANRSFASATTLRGDGGVDYAPHNLSATEGINAFRRTHRSTTTSVTVRDFDWTLGGYVVDDRAEGEDPRGRDRESYEHGLGRELRIFSYDRGPRRYQEHDAARQKQGRQEAHVFDSSVTASQSRSPRTTFQLGTHERRGRWRVSDHASCI
jgi:type VI secretion system secreted protein VgrG